MNTIRTTYVARTSLGVAIATFDTEALANRWADENGDRFSDWTVTVETERTITTSRVIRRDEPEHGEKAA